MKSIICLVVLCFWENKEKQQCTGNKYQQYTENPPRGSLPADSVQYFCRGCAVNAHFIHNSLLGKGCGLAEKCRPHNCGESAENIIETEKFAAAVFVRNQFAIHTAAK